MIKKWNIISLALILFNLAACTNYDELPQQADPDFIPKNTNVSFLDKNSPIVLIDEAHSNFHTIKGRYKPFYQVLKSDGYTVKSNTQKFTLKNLKKAHVLVISNAVHKKNRRDWTPPHHPAFEEFEVHAIKEWVLNGGSLFLIIDHIPFPKAAEELASAFGFKFVNGHVRDAIFHLSNNSLTGHAITHGNSDIESISTVKSFGGSAFQTPKEAISLLNLSDSAIATLPEIPFKITATTKRISLKGWSQGAILKAGKGRLAIFAEAAMFTSQIYIPTNQVSGLTSKGAEQNEQFLLNIMHWLSHNI